MDKSKISISVEGVKLPNKPLTKLSVNRYCKRIKDTTF